MRLTVDDIIAITTHIKGDLIGSILDQFKKSISNEVDVETKHVFTVQGKEHSLSFKQLTLVKNENAGAINDALELPVKEIECYFNNHSLSSIYVTKSDIEDGLFSISEIVPLFLCSEILKLCFRKWYEPNIVNPTAGCSLPGYNNFIKSILQPLGYNTSLSWDGKVFNFSVFCEEGEFEVIAQTTSYTSTTYLLQEESHLYNIKNMLHDVFLELFRTKKISANIVVEL